jgi:hypothetical protein
MHGRVAHSGKNACLASMRQVETPVCHQIFFKKVLVLSRTFKRQLDSQLVSKIGQCEGYQSAVI